LRNFCQVQRNFAESARKRKDSASLTCDKKFEQTAAETELKMDKLEPKNKYKESERICGCSVSQK
jgi:hypothetical protein